MIDAEQLRKDREIAEAATPGPWSAGKGAPSLQLDDLPDGEVWRPDHKQRKPGMKLVCCTDPWVSPPMNIGDGEREDFETMQRDRDHIANMDTTHTLELLDEIERLRNLVEHWRGMQRTHFCPECERRAREVQE